MAHEKPYEFQVGGTVVLRCADARAAAELIRELQGEARSIRPRKPQVKGLTAKKALLEGQYRVGIDFFLAHPDGAFADELIAKLGLQENPKALGGYMTGLRNQCRKAGLPSDAIVRERRKNGTGWKNHLRLEPKAAETIKKWLEGLA